MIFNFLTETAFSLLMLVGVLLLIYFIILTILMIKDLFN